MPVGAAPNAGPLSQCAQENWLATMRQRHMQLTISPQGHPMASGLPLPLQAQHGDALDACRVGQCNGAAHHAAAVATPCAGANAPSKTVRPRAPKKSVKGSARQVRASQVFGHDGMGEEAIPNTLCNEGVEAAEVAEDALANARGLPPWHAASGALSILGDAHFLAAELELQPGPAGDAAQTPGVALALGTFWPPLQQILPRPRLGRGVREQHFGLLYGCRMGGVLQLAHAELCPEAYLCTPGEAVSTAERGAPSGADPGTEAGEIRVGSGAPRPLWDQVAALTEQHASGLRRFLEDTFLPWCDASSCRAGDAEAAAWFVCNDGQAFAIQQVLLNVCRSKRSKCSSVDSTWQETLVVLDRACEVPRGGRGLGKMDGCCPAVEVFHLSSTGGHERILFDVC